MALHKSGEWIDLDCSQAIWQHFYTVAPLVVIGTKENEGYDLAPKHMATPLGDENYFGFVCTPRHRTYHNVIETQEFSVSFPLADQVTLASLAASPRTCTNGGKQIVHGLPTDRAKQIDALLMRDAYLFFECKLDRIVDGFGDFSLIAGKIIRASVSKKAYRITDGDDEQMIAKMPMLAYLAYDRFAEIHETTAFPFPRGFSNKFSNRDKGDAA